MAIVNPPEFMQNSSYTAKRWRRAMQNMSQIQAGVHDGFTIVPAGSGWGFTVLGGSAFVPVGFLTTQPGLYHVEADNAPSLTGTLTAAHATLPRIDQIVIQVDDVTDAGSADDVQQIAVLTGTPTSGATLGNRTGAAAIPTNTLLLADVLVPGGATSIATATVRDRRTMARGFLSIQTVTSGDITIGSLVTSGLATTRVNVGRVTSAQTVTLIELGVLAKLTHSFGSGANQQLMFQTQTVDSGTWNTILSGRYWNRTVRDTKSLQVSYVEHVPVSSGFNFQFRIAATTSSNSLTVGASATNPLRFWAREIVRPVDTLPKEFP